jgi:hypothetical protein
MLAPDGRDRDLGFELCRVLLASVPGSLRVIVSPAAGGVTFRRRILSYALVRFLRSILGFWFMLILRQEIGLSPF